MKNSLHKNLLLFLTLIFSGVMLAQEVSGSVSDGKNPISGVNVSVKGTRNATGTDFDGKFKLKNVSSGAVLVISYLGKKTQEVAVDGQANVEVVLVDDASDLKEIVIGYGKVKKKDATGAVDQLSSKQFDNISATSAGELLRGKVAGVQVTSSSGEPGAGLAIRVRGNSSLRSGNNPLIVVDGVPLDGGNTSAGGGDLLGASSARSPLNFINQNDIESISILKDASSTAIYGSRGSNGVIIITTKKGKSKEPQLNFSTSVQFSSLATSFDVMSAQEFVSKLPTANIGNDKGSRGYNWKDAILQNGMSQSYDLGYSSGTDNSSTRISLGLNKTDGIVKKSGLDKYTASFANSTNFFDGFMKLDTRILYSGIRDRAALTTNNAGYIGNIIGTALYWNPTLPSYNATGGYTFVSDDYVNPVHLLDAYTDYTDTNKLIGNITSSFKLSNNLKYQFLFGVETSTSSRKRQLDPSINIKDLAQATNPDTGAKNYGYADISAINRLNTTFEHTLNYSKDFNDNFALDALVGYSYYDYKFNANIMTAKGFNSAQTNLVDNIQGGVSNAFTAVSERNEVELQSFFGRANFTVYKKFLATITVRRDGGSKLGENNKYETFPSLGLAYKIIEDREGLFNSAKLRFNIGKTGNQEFSPNSALRKARYGNNGGLVGQINPNPDLKWETTNSFGFGLDFTLLKNKLSGSVDYFNRQTKNLIFAQPTASTQPAPNSLKFVNLPGILDNTGLELALNYKIMNTENFNWDFSINTSFIKNKVKEFPGYINTGELNGQGLSGATAQVIANNLPAYTYYMYEFRGYDTAGNGIYSDVDGNNTGLGTASKVFLDKQPLPKMNLGFSTNVSYKNFDAAVSFYGSYGHYIYNNTSNALFFKGAYLGGRNVPSAIAASTQVQGDPNAPSTKYLEKGDFLRMGNLTFGYTYSGKILEKARIKSARFFVNGANLLLFTNYTGFDPEVDTDKTFNGVPSAGIDYLSYPRSKSFSFGLNLNF